MLITKPDYYDTFRCLAGGCPDSCCKEWDVQVDEASAAYYRGLPGALGDRLRQVLRTEDDETVMTIVDGRCPMWREDGLCRIQAELGEEALCHVCREFPRLRHDYGDFVELGLELSCPEAARLILASSVPEYLTEELPGGEEPDYDGEAMAILLETRRTALSLLADDRPVGEALALLLLFGSAAQEALDTGEDAEPDAQAALETAKAHAVPGDPAEFAAFFRGLEILTPQWEALLSQISAPVLLPVHKALARYLVSRYWLQAVSDYDLMSRVKFILISCLLVSMLPGAPEETAQLFSKEIENDADNVDAILDAAYDSRAFTDTRLLGLCLQKGTVSK